MKFKNTEGIIIVENIIKAIQNNRDYLSEIDGLIGDGDHGINMNKGFTVAEENINESTNMSEGFYVISQALMDKIGGSMGPLYGNFFRGLYSASRKHEEIDDEIMIAMLDKGCENIHSISPAKVGDKTLIDVLDPAIETLHKTYSSKKDIRLALDEMMVAAKAGLENTKNLVAKLGRASRLKERSLGHQDAGATSCYLILEAFVSSVEKIGRG